MRNGEWGNAAALQGEDGYWIISQKESGTLGDSCRAQVAFLRALWVGLGPGTAVSLLRSLSLCRSPC